MPRRSQQCTACGYGFRARRLRRPGMTEPGVFATTVRLLLRDAGSRKFELRPERHWLARRRGHRRYGRPVPSAGRSLDLYCDRGLLVRGPSLHRLLGHAQRLRIEPGAELVALPDRLGVAGARRECEPPVRLREVLLHPDPAGIEDREVVLAVGYPVIGRLAKPARGGFVVGLGVDAFRIEYREVVQRLGIASLPRGDIEAARGLEILLHAEPLFVHPA